jgi:hypothetical protein
VNLLDLEQAGEKQENGQHQQANAYAVKMIPSNAILQPSIVWVLGVHLRDAVIDGDQHRHGEYDGRSPEGSRQGNEQTWTVR